MRRTYLFWAAFATALLLRLYLCTQAPYETSDLYRHLGYSSHLPEVGARIYFTKPWVFRPEFWARFWPQQPYIYPPATLVFFTAFSTLGLGLFFVKVVLTLADLASAILIYRMAGGVAGLLAFTAPAALWYVSHEGQYESLLALCICSAIYLARQRRWL